MLKQSLNSTTGHGFNCRNISMKMTRIFSCNSLFCVFIFKLFALLMTISPIIDLFSDIWTIMIYSNDSNFINYGHHYLYYFLVIDYIFLFGLQLM